MRKRSHLVSFSALGSDFSYSRIDHCSMAASSAFGVQVMRSLGLTMVAMTAARVRRASAGFQRDLCCSHACRTVCDSQEINPALRTRQV